MNAGCAEIWWFHNDFISSREAVVEDESDEEPDTGLYQGCSENELMQENSTSKCQILTALDGPFATCHSEVLPEPYYS